MAPLACINLPGLALQIALRRFPAPVTVPVVLVNHDRPSSPLVALNRAARTSGLRLGMRYSEALAMVAEVRIAVISEPEVSQAQAEVLKVLDRWSPKVEPCSFDRGTFWLEITGLSGLFGTEEQWGRALRQALADLRFRAVVLIGWTRAGTYLVAQHRRRSGVLASANAESRAQREVLLDSLPLSIRHRRLLRSLGIDTWDRLMRLSSREVSQRMGAEFLKEIQAIQNLDSLPLQALPRPLDRVRRVSFGYPVENPLILQGLLNEALTDGLADLARRGFVLKSLTIGLQKEGASYGENVLRPGHPTGDLRSLRRLLGLRLESIDLRPGVISATLTFEAESAPHGSGELFDPPVIRDLGRGDLALAMIRAHLGNDAVLRPVLVPHNLPEESFDWEPLDRLKSFPTGASSPARPWAVRRVPFGQPRHGSAPSGKRIAGPFVLHQVGERQIVDREYWLLKARNGEVHWVFWDRATQTSHWQGVVD